MSRNKVLLFIMGAVCTLFVIEKLKLLSNDLFIYNNKDAESFLTLFTTFSNNNDRHIIEKTTITNWNWLIKESDDKIILMDFRFNMTQLNHLTMKDYWINTYVTHSIYGLPVVKNMFKVAAQKTSSPYLAYANSDILFDTKLLKTVKAITHFHNSSTPFLIIGNRYNVDARIIQNVTGDKDIQFLKNRGVRANTNCIDYFVLNAVSYPWDSFLDVVVARAAWDDYMVTFAIENDITTYDSTETVTALHQSYSGPNSSGMKHSHAFLNVDIMNNADPNLLHRVWKTGFPFCAEYFTKFVDGTITVLERAKHKSGKECKH